MTSFLSDLLNMRRIKFVLLMSAFLIVLSSLFRLGFFLSFAHLQQDLQLSEVLNAFYIGAKFDFRLAVIILMPVLVVMLIPKIGLYRKSFFSQLAKLYLILITTFLLLFYALNIGYYQYLSELINISVLRFFDDIGISGQMLWQSYPIVWICLGLILGAVFTTAVIRFIFSITIETEPKHFTKKAKAIAIFLLTVFLLTGIFGRFSQYPLRWSNALFSKNDLVNATAVNPLLYFYRTLKNIDKGYTLEQVKQYYPIVRNYLDLPAKTVQNNEYDLKRVIKSNHTQPQQPNIVVVFLESMANHFLGAAGNPLEPTPYIDSLIAQSIYFKHHYVPYESTAKSTWSFITGIPDPTIVKTATRNPRIAKQHSLLADLKGYERYYFLGGSANWANIRGFLNQSLPDLKLYEEGDYDEYPVINVWGISDLSLFDKAHKVLTQRNHKKPFIAYIQTAQNHPPYTFPDNEGFKEKLLTPGQAYKGGFSSPGRYNAVRLIDHTLKQYMSWVEKSDYAENTIFVFFGDHGRSSPPVASMGKDYELSNVGQRSAAWIYAPSLGLQPQVFEKNVSLVDLLPTVLSLTGQEYINTTLGRDIFTIKEKDHYVLLLKRNDTGVYRVGFLGSRFYMETNIKGEKAYLNDLQNKDIHQDVSAQYPELFKKLKDEAIGLYFMSNYLLEHNKPLSLQLQGSKGSE